MGTGIDEAELICHDRSVGLHRLGDDSNVPGIINSACKSVYDEMRVISFEVVEEDRDEGGGRSFHVAGRVSISKDFSGVVVVIEMLGRSVRAMTDDTVRVSCKAGLCGIIDGLHRIVHGEDWF